jgi:hypothetical protein
MGNGNADLIFTISILKFEIWKVTSRTDLSKQSRAERRKMADATAECATRRRRRSPEPAVENEDEDEN